MKTTPLFSAVLLSVAIAAPLAWAQENTSPTPAPAEPINVSEPAVIDHVVFLARLPTPSELLKGAEKQGTPIARIDQTADRVLVVYHYAGGRTVTFAYTLLSSAGNAPAPVAQPVSTATYSVVSAPAPTTTVVYSQPQQVYYSPSPRYVRYYDPAWDFWAPFAVGLGVGWSGGHHSHGRYYGHGGYYGGHHGRRHH